MKNKEPAPIIGECISGCSEKITFKYHEGKWITLHGGKNLGDSYLVSSRKGHVDKKDARSDSLYVVDCHRKAIAQNQDCEVLKALE